MRRQRPNQKKPPGGRGGGGRGFLGRGAGACCTGSADEVVSTLPGPSDGSLTDSSKFDSFVRQR
jgi:hypothetical protein